MLKLSYFPWCNQWNRRNRKSENEAQFRWELDKILFLSLQTNSIDSTHFHEVDESILMTL